jgi:hypothetical protein
MISEIMKNGQTMGINVICTGELQQILWAELYSL